MSFERPPILPFWARGAIPADVVDPGATKRGIGWTALDIPPHSFFNWLIQVQSEYTEHVEAVTLDSRSMWQLGQYHSATNMQVTFTTGFVGTLLAKTGGFFDPLDQGSIYDLNGKKTTWTNQDLLDSGDDSRTYTASVDTYLSYHSTTKVIEYAEVPNGNPAPTPSSGFVNFFVVVTDGSDITAAASLLPTTPIFLVEPSFNRLLIGTTGFGTDAVLTMGDEGAGTATQEVKLIGGRVADRQHSVFQNTNGNPIAKWGVEGAYPDSFSVRTTVDPASTTLRGGQSIRSYVGADFPITLEHHTLVDDYITVIDHDDIPGSNMTITGRVTGDGSGGNIVLMDFALSANQRAFARIQYTEITDAGNDYSIRTHLASAEGGAVPVVGITGASGFNSGGFTGEHLTFDSVAANTIRIVAENTGGDSRKYQFTIELHKMGFPPP